MVDHVHAWHPQVPGLREVYHATLDHAYPLHTHDDWTVLLVDDGAVAYDLDRANHQATAGGLTLLPPDVPHDGRSAVAGSGYRKRVLYLDPRWLPENTRATAVRHPSLLASDAPEIARRIHAALRHPGDLMAAEHWVLALRDQILAELASPAPARVDAPLARRLRALLDDRYTESFTIAAAADQLGTHPSHLIRVFSRAYGIAPHQYVIGRRVDHARRLIVAGQRPAAAATEAGFHDQAHLTRHFRRVLGVTPAALTS